MIYLAVFVGIILALRLLAWLYKSRLQTIGTITVQDGDSVEIDGEKCRLAGIDAPEWNSPFGLKARHQLCELLKRSHQLSFRVRGQDKFGRRLVTLYGNEGDLNYLMVASGYARAYQRYSGAYVDAEHLARKQRRGAWVSGDFVDPEAVRHPA